jgi:RimJ/RimL family protein N-acetyltransferase
MIEHSLHGPCKTIEESREWMIEVLTKLDNLFYAIHVKSTDGESEDKHIGSVSLRKQADGPVLPPPRPAAAEAEESKGLNLRVLGYALFERGRGKGYATEAGAALIAAHKKYRGQFPDELSYIEAGVDKDNRESIRVLEKLGLNKVGWKEVTEPVFLGGAWRDPGYWIYGLYV